ncbi:MAG: AI-2E family transporter [Anaerolineales bacterium]|nr:AI-2E family transporter [Anaerolineales bacterium]
MSGYSLQMNNTTWSGATRIVVLVLALAAAVWGIVAIVPLVESVGIAALLAYLLAPIVRWLMRRSRMSRSWAATIVFLLFLLLVIGVPATLGTVAVRQVTRFQEDLLAALTEIEQWFLQPIEILGVRLLPQSLFGDLPTMFDRQITAVWGDSLDILSTVTANLLWTTVVLVTLYYLLKDGPKIKPWLVKLVPPAYQPEIDRLLDKVDHIWGKFLGVQLLLFVVFALLLIAGTLLVVWLFRSGLLEWSFLGFVGLLLAVYTAVQQVDNLWLRPQFMGRQLRLHPGIVFIGLVGSLVLSGFLGVLIVVPLIATAKALGQYIHCKLLDVPPWPDLVNPGEEITLPTRVEEVSGNRNGRMPQHTLTSRANNAPAGLLIAVAVLVVSTILALARYLYRVRQRFL